MGITGDLEEVKALHSTLQEAGLHVGRPAGDVSVLEAKYLHIEALRSLHIGDVKHHVVDARHLELRSRHRDPPCLCPALLRIICRSSLWRCPGPNRDHSSVGSVWHIRLRPARDRPKVAGVPPFIGEELSNLNEFRCLIKLTGGTPRLRVSRGAWWNHCCDATVLFRGRP